MRAFLALLLLALVPSAGAEPPPVLAAKAYVLYDYGSNQILLGQNEHMRIEPASLTKLMTAYVTFGEIKQGRLSLARMVTPSPYALRVQSEESRSFLQKDKPVKVEDLLRGLIVQSGNDAARTLAEVIANHELAFATDRMNAEARRLGMNDSHFVNATGLPESEHYSSAYDLALLAAALVRDFPELYPLFAEKEFEYNGIKQYNRNRLLWMDPYVDGLKTGHTESAGFCLVASAKRGERRLISVVIGTESESLRASESQRLLNYGFQNFETVPLYRRNQPVTRLRIWKGTEKELAVGFRHDLTISLPIGRRQELKATLVTQQPIVAPISAGQTLGTLKLTLAGKPYLEFPVVALEPVPLANVFSRGLDTLHMLFL